MMTAITSTQQVHLDVQEEFVDMFGIAASSSNIPISSGEDERRHNETRLESVAATNNDQQQHLEDADELLSFLLKDEERRTKEQDHLHSTPNDDYYSSFKTNSNCPSSPNHWLNEQSEMFFDDELHDILTNKKTFNSSPRITSRHGYSNDDDAKVDDSSPSPAGIINDHQTIFYAENNNCFCNPPIQVNNHGTTYFRENGKFEEIPHASLTKHGGDKLCQSAFAERQGQQLLLQEKRSNWCPIPSSKNKTSNSTAEQQVVRMQEINNLLAFYDNNTLSAELPSIRQQQELEGGLLTPDHHMLSSFCFLPSSVTSGKTTAALFLATQQEAHQHPPAPRHHNNHHDVSSQNNHHDLHQETIGKVFTVPPALLVTHNERAPERCNQHEENNATTASIQKVAAMPVPCTSKIQAPRRTSTIAPRELLTPRQSTGGEVTTFERTQEYLSGKAKAITRTTRKASEKVWWGNFLKIQQYYAQNGHCNVPARYPPDKKLGHWVMTQRRQYQLLKEGKASTLVEDRLGALSSLSFTFSLKTENVQLWHTRFEELKEFKAVHGHCSVPQKYPENKKLGLWVNTQRHYHHNRSKKGQGGTCMTKSRIKLLESVGFAWANKLNSKASKKSS